MPAYVTSVSRRLESAHSTRSINRGLTAAGDDGMLKEAASDSLESMEDGEGDFSMLELDDD